MNQSITIGELYTRIFHSDPRPVISIPPITEVIGGLGYIYRYNGIWIYIYIDYSHINIVYLYKHMCIYTVYGNQSLTQS